MRLSVSLLLASSFVAAACGDDNGGPSNNCTPSATQVCMVEGRLFNPATATVTAGTTLTWNNGNGETHNTTSNPANPAACPTWNHTVGIGGTSPGVQFATGGVTCQYFCSIHATATTGTMRGSIVVQ
jgi:plastocyanin